MTAEVDTRGMAGIFDSLRNLDARLLRVLEATRAQSGSEPGGDPFRGLYISEADVFRYVREPAEPTLNGGRGPLASGEAFAKIGDLYGLSSDECDTLLIALAPEIDTRYERIYAYLHDDVSRRRPSVGLVLNLLSLSAADKLEKRSLFSASSPLVANRLIRLAADEPMPRREIVLDAGIVALLLGEPALESTLARFVRLVQAPEAGQPADPGLVKLARRAAARGRPLLLYFRGTDEDEKRAAATALACELGAPLLIADVGRAARHIRDLEEWLHDLARAAFLRRAVVYLGALDAVPDESTREIALGALEAFRGVVIVSGAQELRISRERARGMVTVPFEAPAWEERWRLWEAALGERGLQADGEALHALSECFLFSRSQIEDAAETAAHLADYRGEPRGVERVFEACRMSSGHDLGTLTRRVKPMHRWSDLVLPEETVEQLHEICRRVTRRHQVQEEWGFSRKLSGGKGVNALFHGHSGTGKTMAAEVVAGELRLDLYKIDLAGVVSKYIGETEKNLDRIFRAAETANAILLFDEADALFGKRSEVRDSHDRYANLEISYLLQKMEQYEGVSILATNLRQNLDDAFLRRLAFTVAFPFPDEGGRRRIWAGIWPAETPLALDVDADWLGSRFLLSGGNIRNAALAAAYLAADDGSDVTLSHVLRAVRAEFQKMGKILTAREMEPLSAAVEA
jgi:hypothetical protein